MCFLGSVNVRIMYMVFSVVGQIEDLSKAHFGSILCSLVFLLRCM